MQHSNDLSPAEKARRPRLVACTLSAIAVLLSLCGFFVASSFVLTHLYPTPQPAIDASEIPTIVAQTAAVAVAQTEAAKATMISTPTLISCAALTHISSVHLTAQPFLGQPISCDVCCRHCTNSQPCGNGCISWYFTCHQPLGCACP